MALSQKGAGYDFRDNIKDQFVLGALDSIENQVQAAINQGNFGKNGVAPPPSPPTALQVTVAAKTFTATIVHPHAPPGTQWRLQYSASPTFQNARTVGLLEPSWEAYLPALGAGYFRVAAKFPHSAASVWTYFGTSVNPTAIS
jgi:hypothetical protein